MTNNEGTSTTALHHDLGKWTTSAGIELSFVVFEMSDGTPVVQIEGPENLLEQVFVERIPSGVTPDKWADLGDRLKSADPRLLETVYAVLREAAEHPELAAKCPALVLARNAA